MKMKQYLGGIFFLSLITLLLTLSACQENPDYGIAPEPYVRIVEDSLTMQVGQTKSLHLSCAITGVEWKSSADSVAAVNYQGRVTAQDTGMAVITATRLRTVSQCVIKVVPDSTKH